METFTGKSKTFTFDNPIAFISAGIVDGGTSATFIDGFTTSSYGYNATITKISDTQYTVQSGGGQSYTWNIYYVFK